MILVKLSNTLTLGLAFTHPWRREATGVLIKDENTGLAVQDTRLIRHSRCEILEVKPGEEKMRTDELSILASATVRCHPKDNFCKETGRKMALKAAIKVLHPPLKQDERAWIWDCYLNRPRPKSKEKGIVQAHLTLEQVEDLIQSAIPLISQGLTGG